MSIWPVKKATAWARLLTAMMSSFRPRLLRPCWRSAQPVRASLARPRRQSPSTGPLCRSRGAVEASSPTTAYSPKLFGSDLSAASEHAERDRQIERRGLLGQLGRGEIDDDPIVRPQEAGVHQRRSMRCVLSLTAASGKPTSTVFGIAPAETSTSTSTGTASMPQSENVPQFGQHRKAPVMFRRSHTWVCVAQR